MSGDFNLKREDLEIHVRAGVLRSSSPLIVARASAPGLSRSTDQEATELARW
jgi:hypothetical protein